MIELCKKIVDDFIELNPDFTFIISGKDSLVMNGVETDSDNHEIDIFLLDKDDKIDCTDYSKTLNIPKQFTEKWLMLWTADIDHIYNIGLIGETVDVNLFVQHSTGEEGENEVFSKLCDKHLKYTVIDGYNCITPEGVYEIEEEVRKNTYVGPPDVVFGDSDEDSDIDIYIDGDSEVYINGDVLVNDIEDSDAE